MTIFDDVAFRTDSVFAKAEKLAIQHLHGAVVQAWGGVERFFCIALAYGDRIVANGDCDPKYGRLRPPRLLGQANCDLPR